MAGEIKKSGESIGSLLFEKMIGVKDGIHRAIQCSCTDRATLAPASMGTSRRAIDIREGEVLDAEAFKTLIQSGAIENLRFSASKSRRRGRT